MYVFFNKIINLLDVPQYNDGEARIFCAWVETCEKKKLGTTGDHIFKAILVRKYRYLKWFDLYNDYNLRVAHPDKMSFIKQRENNKYHILATLDGYYISFSLESQLNWSEVWWEETIWF